MNFTHEKLNEVIRNGYTLEFSPVFEKAFENYKKIALPAGAAFLIVSIVIAVFGMTIGSVFYGMNNFSESLLQVNVASSFISILIQVVSVVVIGVIFAPVTAGIIKMAHLADNGKDFSMATAFDYYKSPYLKELLIAAFLLGLAGAILSLIPIIGTIATYVISFFTFLTIPLIIFADLKAADAIRASVQLVAKQPLVLLGLLIVSVLAVCIGLIAFCIGILFTIPFIYSMYYMIYNTILPTKEEHEIEQIGTPVDF
ncbi:DUF2189 domain-containing protein [Sinomicrobium oceani]|uniref:hypothetical protein n=1 Tax=Sinomicrobium oceani TaxID=1150368 RepID=UPI00227A65CF|nr:hypothetical protein [Sinomicrobium oceani]